jgi:polyisoprenoid-binding protein YceI/predicted MFS family arabinose efflux permease
MAGLPRVVWVLAGGSFINNFGSFVVPFLVLYLLHRGYGGGLAAGAVSAYAAGKIAAGPAGGMLTDRIGPRAVTAGSMSGASAATLALAAVSGPALILATAALTGLVSQLYRPATSAILAAAVPAPRRVRAFGVYQLGVSAGATAGPALGGLVAEHSFLALFAADAAASLCWAILAWRTLPGSPSGSVTVPPQPSAQRRGVLGDRRLARLLAVTVLANLVLFQAQTTLPLWVHRQGLPTSVYGLLLALNSGLVMALQLPATRLTGRWRPEPVIAAAGMIVGAGFTLLALAHTAVLLAAAVTVWSLGELVQWPVAAAYTTGLAPPGMTGRYAGARSFCYGLALLLAPLAGTALYNLSPVVLWAACGAAGVSAAAIIIPRRPGLRPGRRPLAAHAARAAPAEHASVGQRRSIAGPATAWPRPATGRASPVTQLCAAPIRQNHREEVMTHTAATSQARLRVSAAGRYRLDPDHSALTFRTRHLFGLGTVTGTMTITSGNISIDPAVPRATVTATISAASFSSGNRARDRDVHSPRFLHADQYPDITFRAGTLSHDQGRWMLAGELTVRQSTTPVTLAIESAEPAGAGFRARATTRIDRYACGLTAAKGMAARYLDVVVTAAAERM